MNSLFKQNKSVVSILFQLFIILMMLPHTSCSSCNGDQGATGTDQDQEEDTKRYAPITMQVPSGPLTGKNKNVEVTFQLADTTKEADLKNFKLRVSLLEKGDTNSKISYTNTQGQVIEITNIHESLTHFTAVARLNPANSSFKVPFTLITAPQTTHLEASFELLDQQGTLLQQGKVSYQTAPLPVELGVSLTSAKDLQDDQQTISLAIVNKGMEKTAPKQLKLKITRSEGYEAQLEHAGMVVFTKTQVTSLIDLPVVDAHTTLPYDFNIQPRDDSNASFVLELAYEGKQVGEAVTVNWENTRKIKFVDFNYDKVNDTIKYTLFNEGETTVNNLTLFYTVKTPGAQLGKCESQAIALGDLKKNRKKEFTIDNLDFGSNKIATIEFVVAYEVNGTKKTLPSVTMTFTQAAIDLELETSYNSAKKVSITITNSGAEDAEKLKLIYKNVSQNPKGKLATLDGKQKDEIEIDKIETGHNIETGDFNSYEKEYVLDLKEASAATFYFEIQYENKPIASHTETFQEEARLSLNIQKLTKDNFGKYPLYGAADKVVLNIEEDWRSCPIARDHLQLVMRQGVGNALNISTTPGGAAISALLGDELGDLGDDLTLYAKPNPGTKEAEVIFQLQYKGQDLGEPMTVYWEEYELWVEAPAILVSNNPGKIKIERLNEGELDFSKLTVKLTSDHPDLTPQFSSLNPSIQSTTLDQVTKDNSFTLQVNTTNNPTKGKLNVIIKRDTTELVRKQINWINEGVALNFSLETPLFFDDETITNQLTNTGTMPLDLKQVRVKLTNTSGSTFKLGAVSGSTMEENLATITGDDELAVGAAIDIALQADKPLADQLLSGIIIELIDNNTGIVLQKSAGYCVNSQSRDLEETLLNDKGLVSIRTGIDKSNPNTDLGDLVTYLFVLEKLNQKIQESLNQSTIISASHLEFKPILEVFEKGCLKRINELKDYTVAIEKVFTGWYKDEVKPVMEELQRKNRVGNKELDRLDTINEVKHFLIDDWYDYDIDQESIKALYQKYNQQIDNIKAALTVNTINNLEPVATDLPAIQELKQIYQTMKAHLPNLKKDAQAAFNKVVNGFIEREQQKIADAMDEKDNNTNIIDLITATEESLTDLAAQQHALSKAQTDDLGFELSGFDNLLAINYQTLAEQSAALVKFDKAQYLVENAKLSVYINNKVTEIFKNTPNNTTKQAAKKTIEATIKVWNKLKDEKGENLEVVLYDNSKILVKNQLTQLNSELASVQ